MRVAVANRSMRVAVAKRFKSFTSLDNNSNLQTLFEIGFIEEIETTRGNKEVPRTMFHYFYSPNPRK